MITMENTRELIDFEYDGKAYQMTSEEIEAAYRYREREYRQSDAEVAIEYFAFGSEDPESMTDAEYKQAVDSFEEQYGVKYNDLMKRAPEIVDLFFQKQDCNIAENQTWEDTIADVVQRMKMQ